MTEPSKLSVDPDLAARIGKSATSPQSGRVPGTAMTDLATEDAAAAAMSPASKRASFFSPRAGEDKKKKKEDKAAKKAEKKERRDKLKREKSKSALTLTTPGKGDRSLSVASLDESFDSSLSPRRSTITGGAPPILRSTVSGATPSSSTPPLKRQGSKANKFFGEDSVTLSHSQKAMSTAESPKVPRKARAKKKGRMSMDMDLDETGFPSPPSSPLRRSTVSGRPILGDNMARVARLNKSGATLKSMKALKKAAATDGVDLDPAEITEILKTNEAEEEHFKMINIVLTVEGNSKWLKLFLEEEGISALLSYVLARVEDDNPDAAIQKTALSALRCIKSILNRPIGVKKFLHSSQAIVYVNILCMCMPSENSTLKWLTIDLLDDIAKTQIGHKALVSGLKHVQQLRKDESMFSPIIGAINLSIDKDDSVLQEDRLPRATSLLNSIINGHEVLEKRFALRNNDLMTHGFAPTLDNLRKIQHDQLQVHVDSLVQSMADDHRDMMRTSKTKKKELRASTAGSPDLRQSRRARGATEGSTLQKTQAQLNVVRVFLSVPGASGSCVLPYDPTSTVGVLTNSIVRRYPDVKDTADDYSCYVGATSQHPMGLWLNDPDALLNDLGFAGEVLCEYKLKPWTLPVMYQSSGKSHDFEFDPSLSCCDAVTTIILESVFSTEYDAEYGLFLPQEKEEEDGDDDVDEEFGLAGEWLEESVTMSSYQAKLKKDRVKLQLRTKPTSIIVVFEDGTTNSIKVKDLSATIGSIAVETCEARGISKENSYGYGLYKFTNRRISRRNSSRQDVRISRSNSALSVDLIDTGTDTEDMSESTGTPHDDDDEESSSRRDSDGTEDSEGSLTPSSIRRGGEEEAVSPALEKLRNTSMDSTPNICRSGSRVSIMNAVKEEEERVWLDDDMKLSVVGLHAGARIHFGARPRPVTVTSGDTDHTLEVVFSTPIKELVKQMVHILGLKLASSRYSLRGDSTDAKDVPLFPWGSLNEQGIPFAGAKLRIIEQEEGQEVDENKVNDKDIWDTSVWEEEKIPDGFMEAELGFIGTLNTLVRQLTSEGEMDNFYVKNFLSTYRSFTTPELFLKKLLNRYHVPESFSDSDRHLIRMRVLTTVKYWVEAEYEDLGGALNLISDFIEEALISSEGQPIQPVVKGVKNAILKMKKRDNTYHFLDQPPIPIIPKTMSTNTSLIHIDELELARQLTVKVALSFSKLKQTEFFNQCWSKVRTQYRCPNVMALIDHFNDTAAMVPSAIIDERKLKDRVKLYNKFIMVAQQLLKLKNFHSLTAIISGLNNAAVTRLKYTKSKLPKRSVELLNDMEKLTNMEGSYKRLRDHLAESSPPAVPYLGVYLMDLTFIEDGNPDMIGNLINFEKRKFVYRVITIIQKFQHTPYNLKEVNLIQEIIKRCPKYDEKMLYKLSLELEPRNAQRSDIA
eukprot:TRINITY_DN460_c0_g3_i1.p1 TRINITY_DN460_c0_g3~~TRINITY_DN460_c0_g3_i1.p1  ORF type:complete len:1428 (+),score=393.76 TRINITY_DN460_c0_g3_i1:424-4707(+)